MESNLVQTGAFEVELNGKSICVICLFKGYFAKTI